VKCLEQTLWRKLRRALYSQYIFLRMSRVSRDNGTGYVKPSTICILTNIFTTFIFKTGCVFSFLEQLAKYKIQPYCKLHYNDTHSICDVPIIIIFNYALQSSRLIVRSGLDVPTFATRRLHARAPSGGRWNCGREMSGNFA
jgi:hypothetical protein